MANYPLRTSLRLLDTVLINMDKKIFSLFIEGKFKFSLE